jgi:hypothetical protein
VFDVDEVVTGSRGSMRPCGNSCGKLELENMARTNRSEGTEIAIKRMVKVHTEMMRVLTQNVANRDRKELPPGVQQVLDDHSRIVQMMSQIVTSTNNSLPQNDHGGKTTTVDVEMTLQAYKRCGEIGHTSKECREQCPYCDMSHPIGECPMSQVTCFLCEGINHVPVECKFYSTGNE